ncbi:hypothetical protein QTP88_017418 [Uroleucon formosanum]
MKITTLINILNEIGDKEKQDIFLGGLIGINSIVRHRSENENCTKRSFSSYYKVRVGDKEHIVCKKAFCSLFDLGKSVIDRICNNLKQNNPSPKDNCGKHTVRPNQVSDLILFQIYTHIQSFPKHSSHYSRQDNNERKYLSPELNISKMYNMSIEKYEPEFYQKFRNGEQVKPVVNYDFFSRHFNKGEKDVQSKSNLKTEKDIHLTKAQLFYTDLKELSTRARTHPNIDVLSFDFEQNMPLPHIPCGDTLVLDDNTIIRCHFGTRTSRGTPGIPPTRILQWYSRIRQYTSSCRSPYNNGLSPRRHRKNPVSTVCFCSDTAHNCIVEAKEPRTVANDYPDLTNNRKETQNNVPVLLNNCLIGQPNDDAGLISYFLKIGAAQPLPCELLDKQFPRDHNGRSFHKSWYWNKRSTGEVLQRKWLSCSIKNKKIYCLYCALHGFSNWNKGTTSIIMHETSEAHIMASIKAAYRQAEYPLIQHSLPFRGHREGWQENIRGNYKDLVLLLAKYSPALASYVTSVELKGRKTYNFISWQRQNQLIEAIYRNIYDVIKKEILTAVFFSISLDTTFDVSRKEQLSLVIRYINKEDGTVCERLIALRETVLTTGKHLLTMLDTICSEISLDWRANLVGQSSDNEFKNLIQAKDDFIQSKNKEFSFTPLPGYRIRRTKKMPGEISSDQRIIDRMDNFKVNTFYTILDITTTQITKRFNEETMPFFKDLSLFSHKRLREVAETNVIPKDAFKGFSEIYGKFVDEESLKHEYIQFSKSYFDFEKIMNLPVKFDDTNKDSWIQFDTDSDDDNGDDIQYNKIDQNNKKNSGTINTIYKVVHLSGLKEIFPTIYTALSIAVTLPVSSASPERAFSKLKLVKTRLRSTMSEDRLEALMIMACELDVQIDTECVIKYFASNSSVLAKLLT